MGEGWDGGLPGSKIWLALIPQSVFSIHSQARQTAGVRPPLAPIPAFPEKGKEEERG